MSTANSPPGIKVTLDFATSFISDDPECRPYEILGVVRWSVEKMKDALNRLRAIAQLDEDIHKAESQMAELEYHGEVFLTGAYELWDRLNFVLAYLTGSSKDQFTGDTSCVTRRRAFTELRNQNMAEVARQIEELGKRTFILRRLRNIKTHGTFGKSREPVGHLYLALWVNDEPYSPTDVLMDCSNNLDLQGSNPKSPRYHDARRAIQKEINHFVQRLTADCRSIETRVANIEKAIRRAKGLPH